MAVELLVRDMASKPMRQVSLRNILDLFAISELDGLSPRLRTALQGYPERIARAVGDLPSGASWDGFLKELLELGGDYVPASFRTVLAVEIERRGTSHAADNLEAELNANEPTPFEFGASKIKLRRAEAKKPEPKKKRVARMPGQPRATKERSSTPSAPPTAKPRKTGLAAVDDDQQVFIRQVALERLGNKGSTGLAEAVLLAAIRHRAKTAVGEVTVTSVKLVLKDMEQRGQIRQTSGRWLLAGARSY